MRRIPLNNHSRILRRERIELMMERLLNKTLLLVCGAPGQGKTTLVAGFLEPLADKTFWYSCKQGSLDPDEFALSIINFINSHSTKASAAEDQIDTSFIDPMGASFIDLIDSFDVDTDLFVVLDDYHIVRSQNSFDNFIQFFISHAPANIHFIIISRENLSYITNKLPGGQIIDIQDNQLKFTLNESEYILGEIYNLGLTKKQLLCIHELAEGWITGLVMIGECFLSECYVNEISNLDSKKVLSSIPSISSYFENELFRNLANEEREFLLANSISDEINEKMIRTLGGKEAAMLFEKVTSGKLLLSRVDVSGTYKYNPLWREFLFNKAVDILGMEKVYQLHNLRGDYYYEQKNWKDAFINYTSGCDYEKGLIVLKKIGLGILDSDLIEELELLVSQIPIGRIERDPWSQFAYACVYRFRDHAICHYYLERAIKGFREIKDKQGEIQALNLKNETLMFYPGNLHQMKDVFNDTIEDDIDPETSGDLQLLGYKQISKAWSQCYLTGQLDDAITSIEEARRIAFRLNDSNLHLWSCYLMVLASIFKGDFEVAQGVVREALEIRNIDARDHIVITLIPYIAGMTDVFAGDFEKGEMFLELAGNELINYKLNALDFYIKNYTAYAKIYLGEWTEATQLIEEMGETVGKYFNNKNYHLRSYYLLWKAVYAYVGHQSNKAVILARQALELRHMAGGEVYFLQSHFILGTVLRDSGDFKESEQHLLEALNRSIAMASKIFEASAYIQLALLYEASGKPALFREYAQKALELASENSYYHFHVWRDDDMQRLIEYCYRDMLPFKGYLETLSSRRNIPTNFMENRANSISINDNKKEVNPFKVFMLGIFHIERNGEACDNIGVNKIHYLLKVLCLKNKPCSIDSLIDAMWPGWDLKLAKNNFYFTLHQLRKWLGNKNIINFENGMCRIDKELFWTDVEQFESLIDMATALYANNNKSSAFEALADADKLYRGELLEGEILDQDLSLHREVLARKHYNLLIDQGKILLEKEDYRGASDVLLKALTSAFSEEYAYRLLMIAYYNLGNQEQALETYKDFRDYMHTEINSEPSKMTDALRDNIIKRNQISLLEWL